MTPTPVIPAATGGEPLDHEAINTIRLLAADAVDLWQLPAAERAASLCVRLCADEVLYYRRRRKAVAAHIVELTPHGPRDSATPNERGAWA